MKGEKRGEKGRDHNGESRESLDGRKVSVIYSWARDSAAESRVILDRFSNSRFPVVRRIKVGSQARWTARR